MSYWTDEEEPRPPRASRRSLVIVAGALVAGSLVGWLVWQASADSGDQGPATGLPASHSPSADAKSPGTPATHRPPSSSAPASPSPSPSRRPGTGGGGHDAPTTGPLKGRTVVIDPGHNTGNGAHTAEINRLVNIGTNRKECDTSGTSTNGGYPEAEFSLDVAHRLRTLLEKQGVKVEFTHDSDRAWGPCVDERARIGNQAHADAVISIHADGSAPGNRGFHVILPASLHAGIADTRRIAAPSRDLGERIAGNFVRATGSAPSNYIGHGTGLDTRSDLGGLNLSTVPKVFIECANMRDAKDALLVTSGDWRQKAAQGISEGILSYLRR